MNERGENVKKIGDLRKFLDLEVYQPKREEEIMERIKPKSIILKPKCIEAMWKEIINTS